MARTRRNEARSAKEPRAQRSPATATPRISLWVPAVLFAVLTLWLFRAFVFSDQMLYGGDTISLGYVARAFFARALKSGTFPLWNPEILGGTPFVEALSGGDSLYPPSLLLLLILEPYRALGWKLVLHVFAAGFFMFGWARRLGASRAAALVAGTGYMLSPMLVSFVHPGHDGKLFVMSLTPLLFWAVEEHFVRAGLKSFAAIGLVVGLILLTTHFQMAYFAFGAVGAYAFFRAIQIARAPAEADGAASAVEAPDAPGSVEPPTTRPTRPLAPALMRFGLFLAASVSGAALAAVQFVPAVQYVTQYSRRTQTTGAAAGETGRAWSSQWSSHPEEAMSLLIPEFVGNGAGGTPWATRTYWGRNDFKDNLPISGVVLLVLAAASFAGAVRRPLRWFFTGLGLLALAFSLGTHTPVWGLAYDLVPGIKLFRGAEMVMFLFVFAAATLAALGVDRILATARPGGPAEDRIVLRVLAGVAAFLGVLALLASSGALLSFWTSAVYPSIDPGRLQRLEALRPYLVRGAFVSALLGAAVWGLAWAGRRSLLAPTALMGGLVLVVVVDQLRVDGTFVQVFDFNTWAQPDPNVAALLERERGSAEPYRLVSFAGAGQDVTPAQHGIELATGHHPNDLARYRELIGMVGSGMPENLFNSNVLRLLDAEYILWPDTELGPAPEQGVVSRTQLQDGRTYQTLLAYPALPRARLVASAVVKSDEEAVAYMLSDDFDPAAEVVVPAEPATPLDGGPVQGEVRWVERTPNRLRLAVTSDRPALLVVADNWYPAWRASIDGREAPVMRAYHTLRAVPVGAGEHTVEMWYHSDLLVRSFWLSVAAALVLVGLAVAGTLRERRRAV